MSIILSKDYYLDDEPFAFIVFSTIRDFCQCSAQFVYSLFL